MRMIGKKRALISTLAAVAVLALDRLTKAWAAGVLVGDGSRVALPGLLAWRYCENTGAAFSMMSGKGVVLCGFTAAVIIAAIVWYIRHGDCGRWLAAGITLLVSGGLGNLYDRIVYGCVIDFIEVLFVKFAVFNVADIAVVCGTVCIMIGALIAEDGKK